MAKRSETFNVAKMVLEQLPEDLLREVMAEDDGEYRTRLFPWCLLIWMMLCQWLGKNKTLAHAVEKLRSEELLHLRERFGVRGSEISAATGGYSRARSRIPMKVIEFSMDRLNECIQKIHAEQLWNGRNVFLVDGSSLTLPQSPQLLKAYPGCNNQYGPPKWPIMRTCYVHDLVTGVALRPAYGPMYGDAAISEIALFRSMIERLPKSAVVVGDRLYGSFRTCYELASKGHDFLVRLTDDRAKWFLKQLAEPGEIEVEWKTGTANQKKYLSELPSDATVKGRFIWHRLERTGYRPINLFLFTSLQHPALDIAELYGRRWNIETDIRSLKICLKLDELRSKTPQLVEKEVLVAHTAYNFVRHIIALAASQSGIDPRRVSFSRVVNFITIAGPQLLEKAPTQQAKVFERFIKDIRIIVNPKRQRPTEPRKTLARRKKYPHMRETRAEERIRAAQALSK